MEGTIVNDSDLSNEYDKICSEIEDYNFDKIMGMSFNEFYALTSYLGYKPEVIASHLINSAKKSNRDLFQDLVPMIFLLATRGSNITKMMINTDPVARKIISDLKVTYNLSDRTRGTQDVTAITLPRVASVFPWIGLQLFIQKADKMKPAISQITMESISLGYPMVLAAPGFMTLLPHETNKSMDLLASAFALYQIMFSRLIDSKKKTFAEIKKTVDTVIDNARRSTFLNDKAKYHWLEKAGVIIKTTEKNKTIYKVSDAVNSAGLVYKSLNDFPDLE